MEAVSSPVSLKYYHHQNGHCYISFVMCIFIEKLKIILNSLRVSHFMQQLIVNCVVVETKDACLTHTESVMSTCLQYYDKVCP
jgi:hypothetical protein